MDGGDADDRERVATVATLRAAGYSFEAAQALCAAGVSSRLGAAAFTLAASRYPLAGGAAERYALYLLAV